SFNVQKRNYRKILNDEGCRISTLAAVAHNPRISTRRMSSSSGISQSSDRQYHQPGLLENVPCLIREIMWYQQDGCPAHYTRQSRQILNRIVPNR
ncbi:hypothetical protein WN55_04261, partial [Dufourea novaeangliae]